MNIRSEVLALMGMEAEADSLDANRSGEGIAMEAFYLNVDCFVKG